MEDNRENRQGRGRPREFDRESALNQALKLFWEQGYQQTTMSQLCKTMGIKSPSLYCAFGNKANLFLEALSYYHDKYWREPLNNFLNSEDLYEGARRLFQETARLLLLPNVNCGCLTVFAALTLPLGEKEVREKVAEKRGRTKKIFRDRLMRAIKEKQIAPDSDIPALSGALTNFFEGLTLQARDREICLAELTDIALEGMKLLPPRLE